MLIDLDSTYYGQAMLLYKYNIVDMHGTDELIVLILSMMIRVFAMHTQL